MTTDHIHDPIYPTAALARWFGPARAWWRARRPAGSPRWSFAAVAAVRGLPPDVPMALPNAPVPMVLDPDRARGLPHLVRGDVAWWIVDEQLAIGASDAAIAADWGVPVDDVAALRTAAAKGVRA